MDPVTEAEVVAQLQAAAEKLRAADTLARASLAADAISRAYYAVFHAATAVLVAEGHPPRTHEGVRHLFGLLLVRQGKVSSELARTLRNLANDRQDGDYDVSVRFTDAEAAEAVSRAASFYHAMAELLVEAHGLERDRVQVFNG